MIDDLLQVARSEISEIFKVTRHKPDNINLISESIKLQDLAVQVQSMLRTIAAKKQIRLKATVSHDLPPAHADPHRIKQVLNNLINNAIKYTILTARNPEANRDRAMKAGAFAFFQKPADNGALLATIEKALGD